MSRCEQCGYDHRTRADREACDAIHGRVRGYADGGPEVLCALCRYVADWAGMLAHFGFHHRDEQVSTGDLVRPIRTMEGPGL